MCLMLKVNKFLLLVFISVFNCFNDGFRDWIRGSCFYYRFGGSICYVNCVFISIISYFGYWILFFYCIVKFSELIDGSYCYG